MSKRATHLDDDRKPAREAQSAFLESRRDRGREHQATTTISARSKTLTAHALGGRANCVTQASVDPGPPDAQKQDQDVTGADC